MAELVLGFPNPDPVVQTRVFSGLESGKPGFRVRVYITRITLNQLRISIPDTVTLRHHKEVELCRGRGWGVSGEFTLSMSVL